MTPAATAAGPFDLVAALLHTFDTNDRINRYLLEHLPAGAWSAAPPGGKGRTAAAIVAHMHAVRLMWLKAVGAPALPAPLDKATVTPAEAAAALDASRAALRDVLAAALAGDGRIKGFKPDAAAFLGYLIAHDAHHRGQIAQLARQAGHPLPQAAMFGMWEWGSRGRD
ncbi:DinB family protein [Roseisolibacter sp. H3M3-2]|uniref:DinB family protein n=1 Tax=Roseisolibacter sp. H3M3-2 TaxID=3031323 RepID=UPI0023DAC2DC|nr:DinB family protein [Roseisolibacter sp. H3M3-2]MDF1506133.1 DinB family protein [Roseisolibacter sp. H3M3-2]